MVLIEQEEKLPIYQLPNFYPKHVGKLHLPVKSGGSLQAREDPLFSGKYAKQK